MNKQKLVVVGNGMAGMRTVEELLTLAPDLYDITVIGKEPHGNYNRIMLSPVLAGEKTFAEIVLHSPDWYLQQGIELVSGQVVVDINRKTKQVLTDAGLSFDYDRLLLATGSVPFIIPIANHNHACVLSFRDIRDVNTMLEVTQHKQRVAVIGGGNSGVEAAIDLAGIVAHVTLLEFGETLRADAVLQKKLYSLKESELVDRECDQ